MTPEELQRDLDKLWAKVSAGAPETFLPPAESLTPRDLTFDALALMRRQHLDKERGWTEILEAKERTLEAYRRRSEALEAEVAELRRRLDAEEGIVVGEVLGVRAKLEAGVKALEEERAKFESERRALESVIEATRERLASETARTRKLQEDWHRRETQYLVDLKDLQARAERQEESAARGDAQAEKLSESLKEAKNALEKTLSELLRERQVRAETEKEREGALRKVAELEAHFKELSLIWEEERGQWRELWDRERSTWEAQRREWEAWEASLRKERESWQAELQGAEGKQAAYAAKITESLRESSETSARLASVIKLLDAVGAGKPGPSPARGWLKKAAAAAAAALLIAAAVPFSRNLGKPRLKAVSTQAVALESPTGLSYDGARVWLSQWGGELAAFDPKDLSSPVQRVSPKGLGSYRPSGVAWAAGVLWSLDSAQARLVKHKAGRPEEVLGILRTPGPAPAALAFDGASLWLYDAAAQAIYRQKGDSSDFAAVPAEAELVPSALAFVDGRLWAFDSKSRELVVLELKDGKLRPASRQALGESLLAMTAVGREVWALAGPTMERPGYAFIRYRY